MLDASVAEFVGYTCSGMAGCVSRDIQPLAVMQMLVASNNNNNNNKVLLVL